MTVQFVQVESGGYISVAGIREVYVSKQTERPGDHSRIDACFYTDPYFTILRDIESEAAAQRVADGIARDIVNGIGIVNVCEVRDRVLAAVREVAL